MISDINNDVSAATTIDHIKRQLETEFSVSDFGLKIKDRNIFYILYLKDKLSYRRGLSIMIGEKTIFQWDNNE